MRSKSEEKRQQIMTAAMRLFVENGFFATSMDQIATEAGVSKQTVYSHFGGKEGLFCAAVGEKCHSHMLEDELFTDAAGLSCRQRLYTLAERFTELILSEDALCVFRTCVAHADDQPELSQLYFESGPQRVLSQLCRYLEKEHARGVLSVANPRQAAVQLLMMCKTEDRMRLELGLPAQLTPRARNLYLHDCVDRFLLGYQYQPAREAEHSTTV